MHTFQLIADTGSTSGASGGAFVGGLIGYVIGVLPLFGVFAKAGQPGWAAFVPIYNVVVLLRIVGRPVWWIILLIIPVVNVVITVLLMIDLAKSFAQGAGFAVGLVFLSWIFLLILWLGSARYQGPAAARA